MSLSEIFLLATHHCLSFRSWLEGNFQQNISPPNCRFRHVMFWRIFLLQKTEHLLGGGFKVFLEFSPRTLGFHDPIWRMRTVFKWVGKKPPTSLRLEIFSSRGPWSKKFPPAAKGGQSCHLIPSIRQPKKRVRGRNRGRPHGTGGVGTERIVCFFFGEGWFEKVWR